MGKWKVVSLALKRLAGMQVSREGVELDVDPHQLGALEQSSVSLKYDQIHIAPGCSEMPPRIPFARLDTISEECDEECF